MPTDPLPIASEQVTGEREALARNAAIPLCEPQIQGREWEYVKECLDSGWVSSVGSFVERFERELAARVGCRYAVATSSGTAALHAALLSVGIKPDEEVLVSTLTFIAPVNAIRYVGAWPVFIDAEPDFWQMDAAKAKLFLERQCRWQDGALWNKKTGRRVRALLPVHILGHPCDMGPLIELARKYALFLVEDATESLGARYKGTSVGQLGDIACFSFNGNKLVTTGGGGMIVTNDERWARKAAYLTTQAKDNPVEYIHHEIGYNYRLTNIQAAVGCAQLEQLDTYLEAKRRIAARYAARLGSIHGLVPMPEAAWANNAFWMYTVLVNETDYGLDSRRLMDSLQRAGIQSRPLWQPIHLSPAHATSQATSCGVAERLYRDALSLPCSVGLAEADQEHVNACLEQAAVRA